MKDWNPSTTHPGYIEKTIKSGAATIKILRPILDENEKVRRTETARASLENAMREHYNRKIHNEVTA